MEKELRSDLTKEILCQLPQRKRLQQPTNAKCKLIVLVGPTASGKSELAVKLAKKFNGEQRTYEHYYRIYDASKKPIPYCKFQQLYLFARTMNIPQEDIVIQTIE
jgi:adenylate kinase family enzyme